MPNSISAAPAPRKGNAKLEVAKEAVRRRVDNYRAMDILSSSIFVREFVYKRITD